MKNSDDKILETFFRNPFSNNSSNSNSNSSNSNSSNCNSSNSNSEFEFYEIAALPWPKFFNLGQDLTEESLLKDPNLHCFEVSEKMDGSLGLDRYFRTPHHFSQFSPFSHFIHVREN